MEVKHGKVVHVVPEKGYGFIQSDEYGKNLFFHAKDLRNTRIEMVRKGDLITFEEVIESDKGLSCKGVRILED